jgi:hypothetical protein
MKQYVSTFVVECDVFQRNQGETIKAKGTLQPLPIPPTIWRDISMDFIVGLPKSENKSVIMVVVDHLSKYALICALQHPFTTSTVAQIFMDHIFKIHSMPHSIVSDRDPTFTNNFWQELSRLQGTQLHLSIAYHPQTDGQTKFVNKCLETYLRCFASDWKHQLDQWLPIYEWWCNAPSHPKAEHATKNKTLYSVQPLIYIYISNENLNRHKHYATIYIDVEITIILHMQHIQAILITL